MDGGVGGERGLERGWEPAGAREDGAHLHAISADLFDGCFQRFSSQCFRGFAAFLQKRFTAGDAEIAGGVIWLDWAARLLFRDFDASSIEDRRPRGGTGYGNHRGPSGVDPESNRNFGRKGFHKRGVSNLISFVGANPSDS